MDWCRTCSTERDGPFGRRPRAPRGHKKGNPKVAFCACGERITFFLAAGFFAAAGFAAGFFAAGAFLATGFLPATAAFRPAPAENFGTALAAIFRGAPVLGFLPVRAARFTALKVPKPIRATGLPLEITEVMISVIASMALLTAALESSARSATASISSLLFIDYPFGLESRIVPLISRHLQALRASSAKYLSRKSIGHHAWQ